MEFQQVTPNATNTPHTGLKQGSSKYKVIHRKGLQFYWNILLQKNIYKPAGFKTKFPGSQEHPDLVDPEKRILSPM